MPSPYPEIVRARGPWPTLFRIVVFPAVWAVPFALFFGTLYGGTRDAYLLTYKMSLVFSYFISTSVWAAQRFLTRSRTHDLAARGRRVLRVGLIIAGACVLSSYAAALVIHLTLYRGFLGSWRSIVASGMYTLIFTALFGGINFAVVFYRESMERARAVEQARAELARAELRALRAQVNPHFLFNTLNSIAALIAENPGAAEEVTTRLAEVFRYALKASERDQSTLGEELEFLRSYLEIERTRLGERLSVVEEIEPGLESVPLPSLLLQPLVENAVLHGVAPRPEGGTVRLKAAREGGRLVVEVSDDGPGMPSPGAPSGNGFGLPSVRERLRVAGPPHDLEIESSPGRGTRVRVILPLPPAVPAPPASKGTTP